MAKQTIQVPAELQPKFNEIVEIEQKLYDLKHEFEIKVRQCWFEAETLLNLRGKVLKYNKEKKVIEVIEDAKEKDAEMLAKIRGGQATPVVPPGMGSPLPRIFGQRPSIWQRIKNSFSND